MEPKLAWTDRGASSVIGTILLVGVTIIIAATVTVLALGVVETGSSDAPTMSVSYTLVDSGSDQAIAVTHASGDSIPAENLYVIGSKNVDIGGPPGTPGGADDQWASPREQFVEGNNGPQVDVGDRWEAGETVYVDPVGGVDGVTIQVAWSRQPVQGQNPGEPRGEDSFVIAEFTVGEQ
jgi:flagellin-like protein